MSPAPRWPSPGNSAAGLGERLAGAALLLVLLSGGLLWAIVEVAGRLFGNGAPMVTPSVLANVLARLPAHLADPRAAWPRATRATLPGTAGFYVAAVLVLLIAAAIAVAAARILRAARARTEASDPHGAHWATRADLHVLRIRATQPGRLTLGRAQRRLLAAEQRQSVIVLAPTQSLKTTGLAIPALLEWRGPILATSVKSDLLRATLSRRQALGEVLVFDPTESTGIDGAGWTPLSGCATWQGAQRTAAALCQAARGSSATLADADFWYAAAAKLLAPVLLAAATVPEGSIADVVHWIDTQEQQQIRDALTEIGAEAALTAATASWNRDERQRSSIYTTAETVLAAYADPGVLAAAYDPDITPQRLLDGSTTSVYLCAPAHEQQRLRPLFATLIEQVVAAVYARAAETGKPLDPPLLLVLDEAANIAPLPSLDTLAATAAGQGIQLVSVFQDLAQLKERWGTRAPTIVNNHRAKLIGSGTADPDTLEYAARVLGDHAIQQVSSTAGQEGRASTTQSTIYRTLAPPHALRQAEPGSALLIYGSLPPVQLRLRPWFADRALRRLAECGPEVTQ